MRKITWLLAALSLIPMVISAAHAEPEAELDKLLTGTWTVMNETADSTYSGATAIGQVTFLNDQIIVDSGGLAAAGLVAASEESFCFMPLNPISFKFVGRGVREVMYVSWLGQFRGSDQSLAQDAVITIVKLGRNRITMVGEGGCGGSNPRISYLQRIL